MKRSWVQVPLWRRGLALVANAFRLVLLNGLRSWWRDLRMVVVAIGSLSLMLILCGLLALAGLAVLRATTLEAGQVASLRVYLAPDANDAQVQALQDRLAADPRVASVRLISSEAALAEAKTRPGLGTLAGLSSSNPFPASLEVGLRHVSDLGAVASEAGADPAADPDFPTSYDPGAFARLRQWALIGGAVAGGFGLLFAFTAYTVAANAMRSVALARREEVTLMSLLAARRWMLKGPFVVEGFTSGAFAGLLAAAAVGGGWLLAQRFATATFAEVLPGVGLTLIEDLAAGIILAGIAVGSLTAWTGLRRLRA
ncbi:MAG: hypothetical protein E6I85_05345 [Chloroflexi bacterium]|nr:MAG: hypothetical protein E6I85_05345 [Chloroflexota bacterium]